MLRSYLIATLRNLRRHRMYAVINVCGLAAAFVVTIIVGLFAHADLIWDDFHVNAERVYQAYVTRPDYPHSEGLVDQFAWTPKALGAELMSTVPGVLRSVRTDGEFGLVRYGDRVSGEWGQHADSGFFEMFSFELLAGDPATALEDPHSIVLSQKLASTLFADQDAMGQSLLLRRGGASEDFVVTGVAADVPYESTLQFDWVIPFSHLVARSGARGQVDPWDFGGNTYLEIADSTAVQAALAFDLGRHLPDHGLELVPLLDLRLHPQVGESHPVLLYSYGFIAFLVLLLACINFANLAAGMSLTRAREVGVRKVIGAARRQLMRQFFTESLMLSYIAMILAVLLAEMALPGLNRLMTLPNEFNLRLDMEYTTWSIIALAGLATVVGLAAGVYPALLQSRLRPMEILQDKLRITSGAGRVLVVLQFVASAVFITTALVVGRQVEHWQSRDEGYEPQYVICIPTLAVPSTTAGMHETHRLLEAFRREVASHPGVAAVSGSVDFIEGHGGFYFDDRDDPIRASEIQVDPHFLRTINLQLIEGQDFPPDLLASGKLALINQSLAAMLPGPVVGSRLAGEHQPRIIGVVKDFQHHSPNAAVPPVVLTVRPDRRVGTVLVRLRQDDIPETLNSIRGAWEQVSPEVPFTYRFLEDRLADRFLGYAIITALLRWLAVFLGLIACLGVFGMACFAVSRRTKEVGVRKVLGASATNVAWMLSSQYTRLVLLAVAIATPLAYQLSELFLGSHFNRIEVDLLSYAAGGLATLSLTWLVAGYHTIRAAAANPVDLLRYE
jgi:putative ABC transport system permease protein